MTGYMIKYQINLVNISQTAPFLVYLTWLFVFTFYDTLNDISGNYLPDM